MKLKHLLNMLSLLYKQLLICKSKKHLFLQGHCVFSSHSMHQLERHCHEQHKQCIYINKDCLLPTLCRQSAGDVTNMPPPSWGTLVPLTRV